MRARSEQPMWDYFGLSYASYLVLPRVILCAMSAEWQRRLVALLDEAESEFGIVPREGEYAVFLRCARRRFVADPLRQYRHPDRDLIDSLRTAKGAPR